jgi:hypothetical protein
MACFPLSWQWTDADITNERGGVGQGRLPEMQGMKAGAIPEVNNPPTKNQLSSLILLHNSVPAY